MVSRRSSVRVWIIWAALVAGSGFLAGCGSSPPISPGPIVQPAPPPPPPTPPPAPPPTLGVTKTLAFGDSMTEGVDSAPFALTASDWTLPMSAGRPQSYPFKLKALMDARYTTQTTTVYNGGLAGRQAREDEGRFSQALSEARPELVLLMEGANDFNRDLLPTEGMNDRIRAVVDALEGMVNEATRRNIPVMIATLPPQRPNSPRGWGVEFIPRFNDAVREMAAKKGATLVDVGSLPLSLIGTDGLHPSEAGYERIAEIWLDAIKARYERTP